MLKTIENSGRSVFRCIKWASESTFNNRDHYEGYNMLVNSLLLDPRETLRPLFLNLELSTRLDFINYS